MVSVKKKPSHRTKPLETIADLIPDLGNANKGTERGRGMLERSLSETGAGRSILVDKKRRIIAGNKTATVFAEIGGEHIEIVHTDGTKLVVVQRDDLDLDDPNGLARKLALYDNRVAGLDLVWDPEIIFQSIQSGTDVSGLWTDDELTALLGSLTHDGSNGDGLVLAPEQKTAKIVQCPECGHQFEA